MRRDHEALAEVRDALTPEQFEDLMLAVDEARARQRAELRAAIDAAYGHIPRLMRGPLRRVLGG